MTEKAGVKLKEKLKKCEREFYTALTEFPQDSRQA
jgi:hypothetical protein